MAELSSVNMFIQYFTENLIPWFILHGIKVLAVLALTAFINKSLPSLVDRLVKRRIRDSLPKEEERKRIETLVTVFEGTFRFILWIVAILIILPEFGIHTTPILASLGVAGLAIGMAARDIVSDFISGIFIILENQYHLGDQVKIAGVEGKVEEVTLRRTILRDQQGNVYSIPNSRIDIVSRKE